MNPEVLAVMNEWGVSAEKAEVLLGLRRFADPQVIARIKEDHLARVKTPTVEQRLAALEARLSALEAKP